MLNLSPHFLLVAGQGTLMAVEDSRKVEGL